MRVGYLGVFPRNIYLAGKEKSLGMNEKLKHSVLVSAQFCGSLQ